MDDARDRKRAALAGAFIALGVLFSIAMLAGFIVLARDTNPAAAGSTAKPTSASPSPSASRSPSATPKPTPSDDLAGVVLGSEAFTGKARDFICHTPTVSKGDVTSAAGRRLVVARTQWVLTEMGYDPGPIDGIYNARTQEAVRNLQGDNGLDVDGLVGPKTWNVIEQATCDGPVIPIPAGTVLLGIDPDTNSFSSSARLILCSAQDLPVVKPSVTREWGAVLAQYVLVSRTGADVAVDGLFGPSTVEAVRNYQGDRGLKETGQVDAATWSQLRGEYCGG